MDFNLWIVTDIKTLGLQNLKSVNVEGFQLKLLQMI